MMKNTTLLLIALLVCTSVNGQINKFEIGLEGGPSLTTLRGNDVLNNFDLITIGYSGGITFQYNLSKLISLRTNLSYERKGITTKYIAIDTKGNIIGENKFYSKFDYLTLPLLTRMNFGKRVNFFVNAGPYIGYLIKQKSITKALKNIPESITDNTSDFRKLDIGLTGGFGCRLPIRNNLIMNLEIRHNLGLNNISKFLMVNDGKILTNSTNLLIGFAYQLEKKTTNEK